MNFYEILYVSTIAPDAPLSIVSDIAVKARMANTELDITGMLVFDGMRFCEQLEGSQKQVLSLLERIQNDTRHINVEVVHHGPLAERRFSRFSMGYSSLDDDTDDALSRIEKLDGQAAIEAFMGLLPTVYLGADTPQA